MNPFRGSSNSLNLLANAGSSVWIAAIGLLFVPLYLRYVGVEAYGLIGAFATVQALAVILDVGVSPTLNRELARFTAGGLDAQDARDLVRTVESIAWAVAAGLAVTFLALGPQLGRSWFQSEHLSQDEVAVSVVLLGLGMAVQWPSAMYQGGLQGLQRQVLLSSLLSGIATLRAVGSVAVLMFISATPIAFFSWQLLVGIVQTLVLGATLWTRLPKGTGKAGFRMDLMRHVWGFAAGMTAITLVTLLLTQTDKIVLSRVLPLSDFGYYALAGTVAAGLGRIFGPFYITYFPRFCQYVAAADDLGLRRTYHRACALLSIALLPAALLLAVFSKEVLHLWTGDAEVAAHAGLPLALLAIGTTLNGLMNLPYALQLAYGNTRLALTANCVAVVVLVPTTIVASLRWQATGAALTWVMLNFGYVVIVIPLTHSRWLRGELRRWYLKDVAQPLLWGSLPIVAARLFLPITGQDRRELVLLLAVAIGGTAASALSVAWTRAALFQAGRRTLRWGGLAEAKA